MTKGKPTHMRVIADKKNKGFGTTFTKDGGRNKDGTRNRDGEDTDCCEGVRCSSQHLENQQLMWAHGMPLRRAYEHPGSDATGTGR